MNPIDPKSLRLAARMGFWGAAGIIVLFIGYTVCFALIQLSSPLSTWTGLADYVTYTQSTDQTLKTIAQAGMLLFGPVYLLVLNSLYDLAPDRLKSLVRLSIIFGGIFAMLTGMHYFIQITSVRLEIASGQTDGLAQFIQANPNSSLGAANMLGWSLFFGLSSLLVAPIFSGGILENTTRVLFTVNGIACILGGIGYMFEILPLVLICSTFIMGGAVLGIGITLCIFFSRLERSARLKVVDRVPA